MNSWQYQSQWNSPCISGTELTGYFEIFDRKLHPSWSQSDVDLVNKIKVVVFPSFLSENVGSRNSRSYLIRKSNSVKNPMEHQGSLSNQGLPEPKLRLPFRGHPWYLPRLSPKGVTWEGGGWCVSIYNMWPWWDLDLVSVVLVIKMDGLLLMHGVLVFHLFYHRYFIINHSLHCLLLGSPCPLLSQCWPGISGFEADVSSEVLGSCCVWRRPPWHGYLWCKC